MVSRSIRKIGWPKYVRYLAEQGKGSMEIGQRHSARCQPERVGEVVLGRCREWTEKRKIGERGRVGYTTRMTGFRDQTELG